MPTDSLKLLGCTTIEAAIVDRWIELNAHPALEWTSHKLTTGSHHTGSGCCGHANLTVKMAELQPFNLMNSLRYYRHSLLIPIQIIEEISKLPFEHESLDFAYMQQHTLKNLPERVENTEWRDNYFYVHKVIYEPIVVSVTEPLPPTAIV